MYLDGVHVGDAAQNQFQIGLRYEPFRGAYIRPSFLLFSKYYAAFNPETILDPGTRAPTRTACPPRATSTCTWATISSPCSTNGTRFGLKGSILNVLNEFYFTDVSNRATTNTGSLNQLQAFFNRGRTFTVGLSATVKR